MKWERDRKYVYLFPCGKSLYVPCERLARSLSNGQSWFLQMGYQQNKSLEAVSNKKWISKNQNLLKCLMETSLRYGSIIWRSASRTKMSCESSTAHWILHRGSQDQVLELFEYWYARSSSYTAPNPPVSSRLLSLKSLVALLSSSQVNTSGTRGRWISPGLPACRFWEPLHPRRRITEAEGAQNQESSNCSTHTRNEGLIWFRTVFSNTICVQEIP